MHEMLSVSQSKADTPSSLPSEYCQHRSGFRAMPVSQTKRSSLASSTTNHPAKHLLSSLPAQETPHIPVIASTDGSCSFSAGSEQADTEVGQSQNRQHLPWVLSTPALQCWLVQHLHTFLLPHNSESIQVKKKN